VVVVFPKGMLECVFHLFFSFFVTDDFSCL
jgi:hypothetical protein